MGKIQLLQSNKQTDCWYCKMMLVTKLYTFTMKSVKRDKDIQVTENVKFCEKCGRHFITLDMCKDLVKKYPKYYVDVSQYQLKSKPKKNKENNVVHTSEDEFNKKVTELDNSVETSIATTEKLCPRCRRVLTIKKANIPVLNSGKTFYRYYNRDVLFCENCNKEYLDNTVIDELEYKSKESLHTGYTTRGETIVENRRHHSDGYLQSKTLSSEYAVHSRVEETEDVDQIEYDKCKLVLNKESFLHKLGYNINASEEDRMRILKNAVEIYGKRKIVDHLLFLINTRKGQNGSHKYDKAINIWINDKEYVYLL